MSMGSPTSVISGIVHFKSNALARTILKICLCHYEDQSCASERGQLVLPDLLYIDGMRS